MLTLTVPGRVVARLHRLRYVLAAALMAAAAALGVLLAYSPQQSGAVLIPPACATVDPTAFPCPAVQP